MDSITAQQVGSIQPAQMDHIFHLAMDTFNDGKYESSEKLLEECVNFAEKVGDESRLVKFLHWLGVVKNSLGKYQESASIATQLINWGSDPEKHYLLRSAPNLVYLVNAYSDFISACKRLPEVSKVQLQEVITHGLRFLDDIGHADWGGTLHWHQASIFYETGQYEAAIAEYDAGFALQSRSQGGPSYSTASYLLGKSLALRYLDRFSDAMEILEQVVRNPQTATIDKLFAYRNMASFDLDRQEPAIAVIHAQYAVDQSRHIESAATKEDVYRTLCSAFLANKEIDQAVTAASAALWYGHRAGSLIYNSFTQLVCCDVRLSQMEWAATRLSGPEAVLTGVTVEEVFRHVRQCIRFIDRCFTVERLSNWGTVNGRSSLISSRLEKIVQFLQIYGAPIATSDDIVHFLRLLESTSAINLHETYRSLGDFYFRNGMAKPAFDTYQKGLHYRRDCTYCQGKVIMSLISLGELEQARKIINEFRGGVTNYYLTYLEGSIDFISGNLEAAKKQWEIVLKDDPQFFETLFAHKASLPQSTRLAGDDLQVIIAPRLLEQYKDKLGLSDEDMLFASEFMRAINSGAIDSEFMTTVMKAIVLEDESAILKLTLLFMPKNLAFRFNLAESLIHDRDTIDIAASLYKEIVAQPGEAEMRTTALYRLAQISEFNTDFKQAESYYLQFLNQASKVDNDLIYFRLANAAYQQEDLDKAFNYLQNINQKDQQDESLLAEIHRLYGLIYQDKQQWNNAIKSYLLAIELDPKHPYTHYNLGSVYQEVGRIEDARKEYFERIKLSPEDAVAAYSDLALLDLRAGNKHSAENHFQQVVQICRTDRYSNLYRLPWYNVYYGSALAATGSFEQAEVLLENALSYSNDDDVSKRIGEIFDELNKNIESDNLRSMLARLSNIRKQKVTPPAE